MLACKSSTVFFERATPDQITRWRTAAERGVVEAMYLYGRVLLDGPDAVKAQTAGCDWLRRASEHNFSLAQLRLAFCYRDEEGVRRDATETVKLLRKSAEQGHATAQCKLGECYSFGLGVKAELKEGVKWYRKSSQQQNGDGRFQLACAYFTGRGINKTRYAQGSILVL